MHDPGDKGGSNAFGQSADFNLLRENTGHTSFTDLCGTVSTNRSVG